MSVVSSAASRPQVGPLLRDWRRRRRLSQLELALDAGISARHLSFVETGRSRPSAEMVLHLSEQLEIPFRERNRMMLAAGYAPVYPERPIEAEEMEPVREAIQTVLDGHAPYPAVVVDREWNMVGANASVAVLTAGVAPELLEPPANVLRVALHPEGMASRIANLGEWRGHLLSRLARHVSATADEALAALLEELRGYPGPDGEAHPAPGGLAGEIFAALRLRRPGGGELSFFSTVTTFGTAIDITVAELAFEAFFPADRATREALHALPAR